MRIVSACVTMRRPWGPLGVLAREVLVAVVAMTDEALIRELRRRGVAVAVGDDAEAVLREMEPRWLVAELERLGYRVEGPVGFTAAAVSERTGSLWLGSLYGWLLAEARASTEGAVDHPAALVESAEFLRVLGEAAAGLVSVIREAGGAVVPGAQRDAVEAVEAALVAVPAGLGLS